MVVVVVVAVSLVVMMMVVVVIVVVVVSGSYTAEPIPVIKLITNILLIKQI